LTLTVTAADLILGGRGRVHFVRQMLLQKTYKVIYDTFKQCKFTA